jgi:hypothetical protein
MTFTKINENPITPRPDIPKQNLRKNQLKEEDRLFLEKLAQELRTQDNAATANPIYIVQREKRIWGDFNGGGDGVIYQWIADPEYWWNTKEEAFDAETVLTEDNFNNYIEEIEYITERQYVTAHLTKKAAELFIKENKHRYNELRIFVDSQYRCKEWNELTDIIKKNF